MSTLCEPLSARRSVPPAARIGAPRMKDAALFLLRRLRAPARLRLESLDAADPGICDDLGFSPASTFADRRMRVSGHERLQAIRAAEFAAGYSQRRAG
ncbi:hypothetical protein [Jiella sonneratiae]|uniref:DUF1127 domain-containing protein n=1 Tax=Jiella sonneratiae TaxID=2816856 RepID=A0ABS3J3S7_9HYPH|nr:hypothetical protein [Jiella sonneratiae]MBO0904320.1 hypothetical protein [Jiella sonneratiae]